jgi:hypothetical protein
MDMSLTLRSYFDGGNQCDSTQYDIATLAVVSGTPSQWKGFERDWKKNLRKHRAKWLHTTDAVTMTGIFSRDNGWTEKRRDKFLDDCVGVAERHIAKQKGPDYPGRTGLYPCTITVHLKDFVRARKDYPKQGAKTAPEVLATQALYRVLEWGESNHDPPVDSHRLFFDQGEPYRGYIYDRMHSRRARKYLFLLDKVKELAEVNMRKVPAIQLADLYAWCLSQDHRTPHYAWKRKLLKMDRMNEVLGYKVLTENVIPGITELVEDWRLPRKKPTP